MSNRNFTIASSRRRFGLISARSLNYAAGTSAVFFSSFMITLLASSIFIPQQSTNAKVTSITNAAGQSLTLTSLGNINLSSSPTAEGTYTAAKDSLNIKTNASGYQLYLSMNNDNTNGNRLYQNGDTSSTSYLSAPSGTFSAPSELQNNTWGYAIPSTSTFNDAYSTPTPSPVSKWAAMPLRSNAQLIKSSTSSAPDPGDNLDVYYGVKATAALPNGIYSNIIAYTAILSGGSIQDTATISPDRTNKLAGGEQVTISTNLSAQASAVGTVTVTIGGEACTNVAATNSTGGQINITCDTPTLGTGKYDITINIPTYNKTYYIPDGIEYYADVPPPSLATISNMQDMTPEVCDNSTIGDEATLTDTRDGNTYTIRKMEDGRCWMTQNLRLGTKSDGTGATVTSAITLTSASRTPVGLPGMIP